MLHLEGRVVQPLAFLLHLHTDHLGPFGAIGAIGAVGVIEIDVKNCIGVAGDVGVRGILALSGRDIRVCLVSGHKLVIIIPGKWRQQRKK